MKSASSTTANVGEKVKEVKGVKVLAHRWTIWSARRCARWSIRCATRLDRAWWCWVGLGLGWQRLADCRRHQRSHGTYSGGKSYRPSRRRLAQGRRASRSGRSGRKRCGGAGLALGELTAWWSRCWVSSPRAKKALTTEDAGITEATRPGNPIHNSFLGGASWPTPGERRSGSLWPAGAGAYAMFTRDPSSLRPEPQPASPRSL